jgi:hypothetical protein
VVVLPLALIGVAATTALNNHLGIATGVGPGVGADSVILVGRDGVTATSPDGRHWSPTPIQSASAGDLPTPNYDGDAIVNALQPHRQTCAEDGSRCYRVVPDRLAIERSIDGGLAWTEVWSISDRERERYAALLAFDAYDDRSYKGDVHADLTCRTVHIAPTSGVVIAACGLVGFVVGDGDAGWTMVGFAGDASDVPDLHRDTPADTRHAFMVLTFGWFVLLLGAEAHAVTHRPVQRRRAATVARVVGAVIASATAGLLWTPRTEGHDTFFLGGTVLSFLGIGGAVWFANYVTLRPTFPWWVLPLAVAVPVVGVGFVERLTRATTDPTIGWVLIWLVFAVGIAANTALGALMRRPTVSP